MSKDTNIVDIGEVSCIQEALQKTLKIPETQNVQKVVYSIKGTRRRRFTYVLPEEKIIRKTHGSTNRFVILFNKLRVKFRYRIDKLMGRRVNKFLEMGDV